MSRHSTAQEMLRVELCIAEYERRLEIERKRLRAFRVGGEGEQRVGALLAAMAGMGWRLLADRRWPGTRRANVDLLHVGPGGVLVLDVKAWAEPRIEDGRLFRGQVDAEDDVERLLRVTAVVEDAVAPLGLAPLEVVPVLVLAGRGGCHATLGRVGVVGEHDLVPWVARRPARLSAHETAALAAALDAAFPPYGERDPEPPHVVAPSPPVPRPAVQEVLVDAAELEDAMLRSVLAEPVETWMTFISPDQLRLVRRSWNGPARIRGAAGTGKTVVGLHRAAYLAATRTGRVLVTTFVRTLPAVLASLYRRLSPDTADRVDFVGLHAWALRLLRERDVRVRLDPVRAETLFHLAWAHRRTDSPLAGAALPVRYWREEIDSVIKGRGLTTFDQYRSLARVGRRTPLAAEQRAAVWDLFVEYDSMLRAEDVHDYNDVLRMCRDSVRAEPLAVPYSAVIADEVQDLSCLGVQLLHAVAGDGPDGLLLIGDGQQAVYPGGFTLAEAGVSVAGRSAVLRVNYRNTTEILDAATRLVADDEFDDLDEDREQGLRQVETSRQGGELTEVSAPDERQLEVALTAHLERLLLTRSVRPGDVAVLTFSRAQAAHCAAVVRSAGFAVVSLEDYDGRPGRAVKVGTVKRAKGLEFAHVLVPYFTEPAPVRDGGSDASRRERLELERRERFVAMTRARDGLWLGRVAGRP